MINKDLKRIGYFLCALLLLFITLNGCAQTAVRENEADQKQVVSFSAGELIGKPTDTSISINIVPDAAIEYHYQYGTVSGQYTGRTADFTAKAGNPHEIVISGLMTNTKYYYRMKYRKPGVKKWIIRNEYSFMTRRAKGKAFTFTVTTDNHMLFNQNYKNAMLKILNDAPDFNVDMGDTFFTNVSFNQSAANDQAGVDKVYLQNRAQDFFGRIGHSVPIFLAIGNHEEEEGWNLDDEPFSLGVASIQARKAYFPTPVDEGSSGFYSGNTDILERIDREKYSDQLREDYYAFEWGDALFIIFDPYQYTAKLPYKPAAGEGLDDPVTGDQWTWTLGPQQFKWLKSTLENSKAKYKFMFAHNLLGGIPRPIIGVDAGYVRGGAEAAGYFEWGGKNADGTPGFSEHRDPKDFGTKPVHQILVDNKVSAVFFGHDHQFAYEKRDGVVYQETPSTSFAMAFPGIYTKGKYPEYECIENLRYMGYLRVKVSPEKVTVDYIRSDADEVAYSYAIE